MKPARIDWIAFNNEDWAAAIQIQFADGSPFDWTEYSAVTLEVKADPVQPEADLTLTLGSGLTVRSDDHSILDLAAGLADIKIFSGSYSYDVVGVNAGSPTLVVYGTIFVSQGVTS